MQTVSIKGENRISSVYVGECLGNVENYLPDSPLVIITDENIAALYQDRFPKAPVIIMGTGEENKTLATVESVLGQLMELGCDRSWFILGIGGGIVCDLTGFVASVFLRGVSFGFVSTTLLSQVDASVGGKNGANLHSYKNMVGVFSQPEFVICDISMLATLPKKEISNGMAEIIKHGLIAHSPLFGFLESHAKKALNLDPGVVFRLVSDSVAIKSAIVQQDEKESGERRKLNFGHTLGHAAERIDPMGHGRAVAMGIHAACVFSYMQGLIDKTIVQRVDDLLMECQLPVVFPYPPDQMMEAVCKDKKKQGDSLYFVFLEAIGKACVRKISYDDLNHFIQRFCGDSIFI